MNRIAIKEEHPSRNFVNLPIPCSLCGGTDTITFSLRTGVYRCSKGCDFDALNRRLTYNPPDDGADLDAILTVEAVMACTKILDEGLEHVEIADRDDDEAILAEQDAARYRMHKTKGRGKLMGTARWLAGKDSAAGLLDNASDKALRLIPASEFVRMPIKPRRSLVGPWLREGGSALIYAATGVGKTYFALGAAHAVATGQDFLGWKCPTQGHVIYVDGELEADDMQERLGAFESIFEPTNNLGILSYETAGDGPFPDVGTVEGQAVINAMIRPDTKLIVLDSISTLNSGIENEAASWDMAQKWTRELRKRGVACLWLHHAGKHGGRRGTSKKTDIVTTVIKLSRPEDYTADMGAVFTISFADKARRMVGPEAKSFTARMTITDGKMEWTRQNLDQPSEADIARWTKMLEMEEAGKTQTEIGKEFGFSQNWASRELKKAKDALGSKATEVDVSEEDEDSGEVGEG